jgi:RNA polymerase sigma-70 factor, ECF subfamily
MDETRLVQLARQGQTEAFEALVRRFGPVITGLMHGRVSDPQAVEDLVQDVFLAAFERLNQLKNPARFQVWLIKIAKAKIADHYRAQGRERSAFALRTPVSSERDPADSAWGPRERTVEGETLELVRAAMARLGDTQRMVAYLKLWEGLSNAEIAARTGLAEGAVRVRLHRALKTLQYELKRNGVKSVPEMVDEYKKTEQTG